MKSPDRKSASLTPEQADDIAIQMLVWLTGQSDLMGRFLAMSGLEVSDIRRAASEPGFFGGVTGFVMAHEPTLMAFCADSGIAIEQVQAAHRQLAGPTEGVWL